MTVRKLDLQDILEIQARFTGAPGQKRELAEEYGTNVFIIDRVVKNRFFTPSGMKKEPHNGFC